MTAKRPYSTAEAEAPPAESASVRAVVQELGRSRTSAAKFAAALLELHPEYAGGRGRAVIDPLRASAAAVPGPRRNRGTGGSSKAAQEWLAQIRGLIDTRMRPMLDGRLALLGLALLDDGVFQNLHGRGALDPLVSEIIGANEQRPRANEWQKRASA